MRGFTLLEVIMAAGLAIVVGTFLIMILVQNSGFFYKQTAIVSEGTNLNDTLDKLGIYLRQAVSVAGEYIDGETTYTSGDKTLILKLPSLSADGVIENTYDFVVVTQDLGQLSILRLKVFLDPVSTRKAESLILTTLLNTHSFKYFDKGGNQVSPEAAVSVESTISVLSKTGSIGSSRTAKSVINLRNTAL